MTVRWKPLLVLSGVFAVIAVIGVVAIAWTLVPRGSAQILPTARAEMAARQYPKAEIHYKQARQLDGKNPAIYEEMAALYGAWAKDAPAARKPTLLAERFAALASAAKFGKTLKEPRRQLLAAAMEQDEVPESLHWAKDLLGLEPENADACYVVASEALEDRGGNVESHTAVVPEVNRRLKTLETAKAPAVRLAWLKARLARVADDPAGCESVLAQSRGLSLPADASPTDRAALLKLRALDVETTTDAARLAPRVAALRAEAHAVASGPAVAPNRIMRLNLLLERVQKTLAAFAGKADPASRPALDALVDTLDKDIDAIFRRALDAASKTDLHVDLTYADHLRYRGKRDRCLEVVDQSLKSKLATAPTSAETVMGLHAVAVEAALTDGDDPKRLEKAAPHIKALIDSKLPRYQGLGHLFQGAIELERSGVAGASVSLQSGAATSPAAQPKLKASALNHLKLAAALLPNVVEAQARYGVALILNQELSLGRQYLQNAMRLGETEPQYQVWAAWSIVQAGYPEEAEPVVSHLSAELAKGRVPRELEGTLHLLAGEIHQARRSPAELKKALAEYERSYAGATAPPSVQLRMAQIDVQLGDTDNALKRIEQLRALGQGGTAAEHLAVLTLMERGKASEARDVLTEARRRYPESAELVGLEAALLARAEKPKEADAVLAAFLARNPDDVSVVLLRAQVLADMLDDARGARRLLSNIADRTENSAPLVQLALLDLRLKNFDAVAATVAKIRARWKDAAAADLLDAQLALEQGNMSDALGHFDAALKKDPGNKLVQFWKAQIESRLGASDEASRTFETLAKEGSTKQLDSGLSLTAAAQSALANMALQNNDLDGAIRRFEGLRSGGGLGELARGDRWQLVAAYAAKGQWASARKEVAALLNDPKNPPTNDERVRAANFYRLNKEDDAAVAQLDYVLKTNPAQPSAVVIRAYMLYEARKTAEGVALIRQAVAAPGKDRDKAPPVFYLMLAALEYETPPVADAPARALTALDQGLKVQPRTPELVREKYRLLASIKGPKAATVYVESEAKGDGNGAILRILADVYREQRDYPKAEETLRRLVAANPKDTALAAALVRVVAVQAALAGEKNDRDRERAGNDKVAALVKEFRAKFPNAVVFLEEDCDLAFRRGDVPRANAVTTEIDQIAKNSPVGPLLRARIYAAQGRPRDVADQYAEALRRSPSRTDIRLMLGQTRLMLGEADEAVRQARFVLETEPDRPDAVLLEARGLAQPVASAAQTEARRARAVDALNATVKRQPRFSAAYHLLAQIQAASNQRDAAATTLRAAIAAVPDDAVGLTQLVELLAGPLPNGDPASADNMAAARTLAETVGANDAKGNLMLALAIGFHKAGQLELARDWAAKAAARSDGAVAHLNYGDILLSIAERTNDDQAKPFFRRAVEQYDLVLKTQANSIEAVNNKAWILYKYLGEPRKALDLAQGLLTRVDPSTLPSEFFDTLGAIQEAVGKTREAEDSYSKGLRKSPDHPVLNLHMGKLILADARRSDKARTYLEKARAGRNRLSPPLAAEVDSLMLRARAN